MIEITRKPTGTNSQNGAAKLGGLVCNKNAPVLKSAKLGGLVCNKNAPVLKTGKVGDPGSNKNVTAIQ